MNQAPDLATRKPVGKGPAQTQRVKIVAWTFRGNAMSWLEKIKDTFARSGRSQPMALPADLGPWEAPTPIQPPLPEKKVVTLVEALLQAELVTSEAMAKRVIALGLVHVDGSIATHAGQKVIPGFNRFFIPPVKQALIRQIEAENIRAATASRATAAVEMPADPLVVVEGLQSIEMEPHWEAYDGEALTLGGRSVLGLDLLVLHDSLRTPPQPPPLAVDPEMQAVPRKDPFFQDPSHPISISPSAFQPAAQSPARERSEAEEEFDEEKTLTSPPRIRRTE